MYFVIILFRKEIECSVMTHLQCYELQPKIAAETTGLLLNGMNETFMSQSTSMHDDDDDL